MIEGGAMPVIRLAIFFDAALAIGYAFLWNCISNLPGVEADVLCVND